MTTDQRIDRLVERHEALAQSVELLVHQTDRAEAIVIQMAQGISDLVKIVRAHEDRLSDLED